ISETIHAVAEISAGTAGAAAGRTTPHSPRRLPPTGGSGIGSAVGGASPGAGTSEESMAGGGCVFCGQVSVTGVANGVVVGGGGCAAAGAPTINGPAASTAAVRTEPIRRAVRWWSSVVYIGEEPRRFSGQRDIGKGLAPHRTGTCPVTTPDTTQPRRTA